MSREMMIYKQGPLNATPLTTSTVSSWDEAKLAGPKGGFMLEGTIITRKRHTIQDNGGARFRYAVLTVSVKSTFKRQYDANNVEIELATGTTKKVSTGFLHSSYKTEQREASGEVTVAHVRQAWGKTFTDLSKFDATDVLVEIWGDENEIRSLDFENGDQIRCKTRGNAPLLDFITRMDASNVFLNNFAGNQASETWTENVFNKGKTNDTKPLPQDKLEGAGDDEWD